MNSTNIVELRVYYDCYGVLQNRSKQGQPNKKTSTSIKVDMIRDVSILCQCNVFWTVNIT